MKNNFDFYLKLRTDFEAVLSAIDFINCLDEWYECNCICPDTFDYYDMILKCECYQAGFINEYQYKKLNELLQKLYFLNELDYLSDIVKNDGDEKTSKILEEAQENLIDFKELLSISFEGYHKFNF